MQQWRRRAREVTDPAAWDYLETGAGQEVSLREATRAWRRWWLRPRVLRDVSRVDTSTTVLGARLRTPVLVAPSAAHDLYHRDGELATAAGTAAAGSLLCLSTRSTRLIEDVAAHAGPWWMQVYVADREITAALVRRAAAAGAGALVLTVDTPYVSRRARSGRAVPLDDGRAQVNVAGHLAGRPATLLEQDPSLTLDVVRWLGEVSGLPVVVKGVLRGDEARACVDAGAAGVVVSNHGGRQLDRALPPAVALPEVVAAVGRRVPVLVDGGLRDGTDVLVALALGADAVMIGRPAVYGLAVDGAAGVQAVLEGLTDELSHAMGLAGCASLADLDPALLVARDRLAGG